MSRRYKYGSAGGDVLVGLIKIPFILGSLLGTALIKLAKTSPRKREGTKQDFEMRTEHAEMVGSENQTLADERYTLKQSLLTDTEREFLEVLEQIVDGNYRIEVQVPLSGIVKVLDSSRHYTNYHDFNQIKAKTIDFVLYDKEYKPYLAIELDDRTHLQPNRVERDHFLDSVMSGVGLRIIHVPVSYTYDLDKLRAQIF